MDASPNDHLSELKIIGFFLPVFRAYWALVTCNNSEPLRFNLPFPRFGLLRGVIEHTH